MKISDLFQVNRLGIWQLFAFCIPIFLLLALVMFISVGYSKKKIAIGQVFISEHFDIPVNNINLDSTSGKEYLSMSLSKTKINYLVVMEDSLKKVELISPTFPVKSKPITIR